VPIDEQACQPAIDWYRQMGWLREDEGQPEAIARNMYCQGCRGDRSHHWSADCWILKCCVDDQGLESCHHCNDFPCQRLNNWAEENKSYAKALERLREMAGGSICP
jgi:hypothetical protein